MEKSLPTFYNKPVLGSFDVEADDFRGHEGELKWDDEYEQYYFDYTDKDSEIPLGLIREQDTVQITQEDDGLNWIRFTCALWVKYNYKLIKRLLKSRLGKKKISVEVEVNDYYFDEQGIEVITDFTFDGVTILSDNLETGIADAELTILDKVENFVFKKKQQCLVYAYHALENNDTDSEKMNSKNPSSPKKNEESEIKNSFENSVDNEEVDAITMLDEVKKEEKGGNFPMTYEAKRALIESWLNEKYADKEDYIYIWIADMDDNFVYFSFEDAYFKASYSIGENSDEVFVDFENKEKVVRSWQVFTEETMSEMPCEDGKECKMEAEKECDMACDGKEEMTDKGLADECGIRMEKDGECKETESCEDKEKECDMSKETEACKESECDGKENMSDDDDKSDDDKSDDDDNDDEDKSKKEDNSLSEGCSFEELSAAYLSMTKEFSSLKDEYNELKEKYEGLVSDTETKDILNFAYGLVDEETFISDEQKQSIKEKILNENKTNKFENEEKAKNFTVSLLAMAVYSNRKNTDKEELSIDINTNSVIHKKKDAYEDMNESAKKLRNI